MKSPRGLASEAPLLLVAGYVLQAIGRVVFFISQFSISQEREIAADAGSAGYNGDSAPLISALTKLHTWFAAHRGDEPRQQSVFRDLMVAHPGLEERVASLRSIMEVAPLLLAPPARIEAPTSTEGAFT